MSKVGGDWVDSTIGKTSVPEVSEQESNSGEKAGNSLFLLENLSSFNSQSHIIMELPYILNKEIM